MNHKQIEARLKEMKAEIQKFQEYLDSVQQPDFGDMLEDLHPAFRKAIQQVRAAGKEYDKSNENQTHAID